jgi:hypothetical protein
LLTTLDKNGVPATALDENHLNETAGLQGAPGNPDLTFYFWNGDLNTAFAPADGTPIDWNHDGTYDTDVCDDASGNAAGVSCGSLPVLQPWNDWLSHTVGAATVFDNFQLAYQCASNFANTLARVAQPSQRIPSPARTGRDHDWLKERLLAPVGRKGSSLR